MKDLSAHRIKVLVVEDNKTNQMIISGILKQLGITIDFADDGEEALDKVKIKGHDMVFMDLQLPKMDGYDTTKCIRKMEGSYFKELPIVALTSSILKVVSEDAKEAGINELLSKSFKVDDFYNTITAQLNLESTKSNAKVPLFSESQEEGNLEASQIGDIPTIMENMSRGDQVFKKELARLYIENIKELKEVFTNSISTQDVTAASSIAHKVNFTLNTLEAEQIKRLIQKGKKILEEPKNSKELKDGFNVVFSDSSDDLIKELKTIAD